MLNTTEKQWLLTNDGNTIWLRCDFYNSWSYRRTTIIDEELAKFIIEITGIIPPNRIVKL